MRRVIVPRAWQASLLRERSGDQRVTSIELFFDLVYVFAVTQLSHHLLANPTVEGALETALLLVLVWLAWVYTTWVTNWLDPERIVVRLMLVALMLVSLVMSAALPAAFTTRGLAVGGAYATMQVGRSAFVVVALSGQRLQRNFERILAWCLLSGALAVAGGIAHGHTRELLWLLAAGVDLLGGAAGFYTPGLGRSATSEWTIEGGHFAERCQGFVIIALGESIVVIGAALSQLPSVTPAVVAAFAAAFAGSVASWWVYFDRSADEAARVIAASADPGRLGRSAYHSIHPVMVAGIIVSAAADQKVLSHPAGLPGRAGNLDGPRRRGTFSRRTCGIQGHRLARHTLVPAGGDRAARVARNTCAVPARGGACGMRGRGCRDCRYRRPASGRRVTGRARGPGVTRSSLPAVAGRWAETRRAWHPPPRGKRWP